MPTRVMVTRIAIRARTTTSSRPASSRPASSRPARELLSGFAAGGVRPLAGSRRPAPATINGGNRLFPFNPPGSCRSSRYRPLAPGCRYQGGRGTREWLGFAGARRRGPGRQGETPCGGWSREFSVYLHSSHLHSSHLQPRPSRGVAGGRQSRLRARHGADSPRHCGVRNGLLVPKIRPPGDSL